MKNVNVMKKLFLLFFCLGFFCTINSQEAISEKQARKEAKQAEMLANFNKMGSSFDSKHFVIEMEYILDASGNNKKLNQLLNYISIDSSKCFWASESSDINTDLFKTVSKVEGHIDGWKLEKNEKKSSFYLQFKMFTDYGLFYVTASVNSDKTCSGNISGVRDTFTYSGRIVYQKGSGQH